MRKFVLKGIAMLCLCAVAAGGFLLAACIRDAELTPQQTETQALEFYFMSEEEAVEVIGRMCRQDMKQTGILASVSAAQFILESGYGKSTLAQGANNMFGMKASLSGNGWKDTTWDGVSVLTKNTKEQLNDGTYIDVVANFRKYTCVEDSVRDHSAYLLNAKNGDLPRYMGIRGMRNYEEAAKLIKAGGYATSHTYVEKICNLIVRWDLTRFDL